MVIIGDESSYVSEVKGKRDQDPILIDLKENFHNQRVLNFEQWGDGVLKYLDRFYISTVDGHQERIMQEADKSRYTINHGTTN